MISEKRKIRVWAGIVAGYVAEDSRSLMYVDDKDLISEIRIRLSEYVSLPATELSEALKKLLKKD